MGKSGKSGWDIRERKDPKSGLIRSMAIRYSNGNEVEHHWLDVDKTSQTEWGELMDANTDNRITLRKDELNQKYWNRYKAQTDYPGQDTKIEKSSSTYKEKLDKYRNSSTYKQRYSKNSIASVQCKSETAEGVRCQNLTTDASGFCYLHMGSMDVENSVRCQGINRDGSRCLNATTNENKFCSIHQDQIPVIPKSKEKKEAEFMDKIQNNSEYWDGTMDYSDRNDYLEKLAKEYDIEFGDIRTLSYKVYDERKNYLKQEFQKEFNKAMKDPETKDVYDHLIQLQKEGKLVMDSSHIGLYEKIGEDGENIIVKQIIAAPRVNADDDSDITKNPILNNHAIKLKPFEVDKDYNDMEFEGIAIGVAKRQLSYDISTPSRMKKPISHLTYLKRQKAILGIKSE